MTGTRTFALPDVGEGLTEAEIVRWHVAVGDPVEVNQVIVEVETAKAVVELPCPYSGTVAELLAEVGATVEVGTPIIAIATSEATAEATSETTAKDTSADAEGTSRASSTEPTESAGVGDAGSKTGIEERVATLVGYGPKQGTPTRRRRAKRARPPGIEPPTGPNEPANGHGTRTVPLAKPPVRKLAKELGVDLRQVRGTGPHGVITRADLRARASGTGTVGAPTRDAGPGERRVPIRGVRKATAQAMVRSAFTAPHVTEFLTVDVTELIALRDRLRASREFAGVKLTVLAFAAKAVCLAMRRTPELNASWDEDAQEIVYYDRVRLGIAAATPRGLVVPKIADADQLSLRELADALTQLTETAREGKTAPEDMLGGTFTITNIGVFGIDTGTPILNPGEAGILALGAVREAPWVVDGELAVRTVCQLALSFDHRLVDGEQGSRFLADVGALLADPGLALTY